MDELDKVFNGLSSVPAEASTGEQGISLIFVEIVGVSKENSRILIEKRVSLLTWY